MADVLRVKEPFSFDENGVPVTMRLGALIAADDPRVQGHEQFFEPAEDAASRSATETTTADPGEQRIMSPGSATRRRRRTEAPAE